MSQNSNSNQQLLSVDEFCRLFPTCPLCHHPVEFLGYFWSCSLKGCNSFLAFVAPENIKFIDELELESSDTIIDEFGDEQEITTIYRGYLQYNKICIFKNELETMISPWDQGARDCSKELIIQLFQKPERFRKFLLLG